LLVAAVKSPGHAEAPTCGQIESLTYIVQA
jgi:hypothetical protein